MPTRQQFDSAIKKLVDRNNELKKQRAHAVAMIDHDHLKYSRQRNAIDIEMADNLRAIREIRWQIPLDQQSYRERQGQW